MDVSIQLYATGCVDAGNYDEYFGMATDVEAVVYMMLMNEMLHSLFPSAITVGEDVSRMPTLCRSAWHLTLHHVPSCPSTACWTCPCP